MSKKKKFNNPLKDSRGGSSNAHAVSDVPPSNCAPNVGHVGSSSAPNVGKDTRSLRGKAPNVDSLSANRSGNLLGRNSVAPNVTESYTSSDNVIQTPNIRRKSSTPSLSSSCGTHSGNVKSTKTKKRKSSTPKAKSTQTKRKKQTIKRTSKHKWTVDIINAAGKISHNVDIKLSDMFNLAQGLRVIVEWDKGEASPYGNGAGLLAGVCGHMATDYSYFPISFKSWDAIPDTYFDNCWNNIFELKFHFLTCLEIAQRFVYQSLNKKWRESRLNLWDEFFNPSLSRIELIANLPNGIQRDQWATYVDYRLDPDTKRMCRVNKKNRGKQIPHSCGAKSLQRRKHEMEVDSEKPVGRGPLYLVTHKKKGGEYTCHEAQIISENIEDEIAKNPASYSEISPTDPVGKNHKKEYGGRVRSLGLGATPSISFKQARHSFKGVKLIIGESSGPQVPPEDYNKMKALMMKFIRQGHVSPEEFEETFGEPLEPKDMENDFDLHGDGSWNGSNQD